MQQPHVPPSAAFEAIQLALDTEQTAAQRTYWSIVGALADAPAGATLTPTQFADLRGALTVLGWAFPQLRADVAALKWLRETANAKPLDEVRALIADAEKKHESAAARLRTVEAELAKAKDERADAALVVQALLAAADAERVQQAADVERAAGVRNDLLQRGAIDVPAVLPESAKRKLTRVRVLERCFLTDRMAERGDVVDADIGDGPIAWPFAPLDAEIPPNPVVPIMSTGKPMAPEWTSQGQKDRRILAQQDQELLDEPTDPSPR